jgi:hypothetical protein
VGRKNTSYTQTAWLTRNTSNSCEILQAQTALNGDTWKDRAPDIDRSLSCLKLFLRNAITYRRCRIVTTRTYKKHFRFSPLPPHPSSGECTQLEGHTDRQLPRLKRVSQESHPEAKVSPLVLLWNSQPFLLYHSGPSSGDFGHWKAAGQVAVLVEVLLPGIITYKPSSRVLVLAKNTSRSCPYPPGPSSGEFGQLEGRHARHGPAAVRNPSRNERIEWGRSGGRRIDAGDCDGPTRAVQKTGYRAGDRQRAAARQSR